MSNTAHITINQDEELVVRKKVQSAKPHFDMLGSGKTFMAGTRLPAIDMVAELLLMTKAEGFAFIALRDNREYVSREIGYGIFISIVQTEFTSYQKKLFREGINGLIEKNIVKRVKRGVYMVSPMAIVPPKDFEQREKIWNKY